jgi:hypothetical protein
MMPIFTHTYARSQRELAECFLKLLHERCQHLIALGRESLVLSVRAREGNRIQLILRNGSRWIVQRSPR